MNIKAKKLFILIGDDLTGKTTIQKLLIKKITGADYTTPGSRLPTNQIFDINHPEIKRKYRTISFGNRSFQEKKDKYKSVQEYFSGYFGDADIVFISSHLVVQDIDQMILEGKRRFFNVHGVFWSNSIFQTQGRNSDIAALNWDERLIIDNPHAENQEQINFQLNTIAESIINLIINKTSIS